MATIIKTNGERIEVSPKEGNDIGFTLEEVKKIVGGWVEVIYLQNDKIMIINDEGKFTKKANSDATDIAHANKAIYPNDYICGDVLICDDEQFK